MGGGYESYDSQASDGGGKIGPDRVRGGKDVTVGSENTGRGGSKSMLGGQEEGRETLSALLVEIHLV